MPKLSVLLPSVEKRGFEKEFRFTTSRSSGPGGQNVNKVNTRVELRISISESQLLSESEKQRIFKKISNRINTEGELVLSMQQERSQLGNKKLAIQAFYRIIKEAIKKPKRRIKTTPTKSSVKKRINNKKKLSEKKKLRKRPSGDH